MKSKMEEYSERDIILALFNLILKEPAERQIMKLIIDEKSSDDIIKEILETKK